MDEPFFLHQHLNNFDEFCVSARNWDLDYRQLDAGDFSSELLMFGNDEIQFTHARLGRRMLQNGSSPQGLVSFGILSNPDINIYWRNINITGDMLFVFPDNGELHSITQADFDVFVISLPEDALNQACASLELPDIKALLNKNEVFCCYSKRLAELRSWLLSVKHETDNFTSSVRNRRYLRHIEQEVTYRLLNILAEPNKAVSMRPFRKRDLALMKAERFIVESDVSVITIPELCMVANVSERTLEYAFRERYGLTPKAYTLIHRMNNIHKYLRRADPQNTLISEIARQYGFWHMGKFSADYKKIFGELPSETLKYS